MYNFNSTQRNAINKFIYDQYGEKQRSNVPTPNPSANASSASTLNTPTTTTSVGTATYYPTTTTSVSTATYRPTTTSSVGTATYYPTTTTSVSTATYRPTTTTPVTVTNNPTITTPVVSSKSDPSSTSSVTTTASIITDDYLMQQCIDKILKDYSRGNLRTEDLKSLLSTLKISVNVITKDNSIVAKFSAFNKSYTVVCVDKAAATSGVDSKKVNTFSASYISDYLGTTDKSVFDQFFTPVAISDNKVLEYAIKPDSQYKSLYEIYGVINAETKEFKRLVLINNYLTGYKDSTAKETDDVNNMRKLHLANKSSAITRGNYRELLAKSDLDIKSIDAAVLQDLLNNVVNDFTKGNMTVKMFRTLIGSLGLGATSVKTEKNTENNTTTITFEYNGKNYSVTCNSDAVKRAHDDNQVIVYNIADVKNQLGITDDSVISRFFEVAAEQDGVTTKVALKAEYESLDEVKDIINTELDYLRKQIIANNYLSGNYKKAETLNVLYIQMFSTEDGKQKPISKVTYGTLINDPNMPAAKPLTVTQKNSVLNKAIADFTSGNLSVAMFKLLVKTIGVEESSIQSTTANDNATLTFTYEEKEYSVSCKTSAAQKSYDKNTVKTVTAQEFKEKYGFSDRLISLLVDNGILNSVVSIDGKNEVLTFVEGKSIENFFAEQIDGDNLKEAYYKVVIDDFMELYKEKYGYTPITEEDYEQPEYLTLMADDYYYDYWYDGAIQNLDDVVNYTVFLEEACKNIKSSLEGRINKELNDIINDYNLTKKDMKDNDSTLLNYLIGKSSSLLISSFGVKEYESEGLQDKQQEIVNELLYKSGFLQGNFKIDDLRFVLDMLAISHEITEENGYYVVKFNVAENNYTMRCSISAAENDNDHYSKNGGYNIENPPEQKTYTAEKLAKIYGISQLEIDALVNSGLLKVALEINGNAYQYTMPSREEYQFEQYETYIKRELSRTNTFVYSPVERLNDNGWFDADINDLTSSLQQNRQYGHLLADNTKYQFKIGYGEPMVDYGLLCEDNPSDVIDSLKKEISDYMYDNMNNLEKTNRVTIYINPKSINNSNLMQIHTMFYTSSSSGVDKTRVNGTKYFNPEGSSEIYADSSSNLGSDVIEAHILQGMTNELIVQKLQEIYEAKKGKNSDATILNLNIDYQVLLRYAASTTSSLDDTFKSLYADVEEIAKYTKAIQDSIDKAGLSEYKDLVNIDKLATQFLTERKYLSEKETTTSSLENDFANFANNIVSTLADIHSIDIDDAKKAIADTYKKYYSTEFPYDFSEIDVKDLLLNTFNQLTSVDFTKAKGSVFDPTIISMVAGTIDLQMYQYQFLQIINNLLKDIGAEFEKQANTFMATEEEFINFAKEYLTKNISNIKDSLALLIDLFPEQFAGVKDAELIESLVDGIKNLLVVFKDDTQDSASGQSGQEETSVMRSRAMRSAANRDSGGGFWKGYQEIVDSAWFSTATGLIGAACAFASGPIGWGVAGIIFAVGAASAISKTYTNPDYDGWDLTLDLAISAGSALGPMGKGLRVGAYFSTKASSKLTGEALELALKNSKMERAAVECAWSTVVDTPVFATVAHCMSKPKTAPDSGDAGSSLEITADSILDKWGKKATEKYDEEFGSLNDPFGKVSESSSVTSTEDPSNLPPEYKIDGIDHLTVAEMIQKIINTLEGFYELLNLLKDLKYKCFEQYLQEKHKVSDINSLDDDDRKNYENLFTQTNIYLALNEKEMSYMTCIFDLEIQLAELQ